jgi:inactive STAND
MAAVETTWEAFLQLVTSQFEIEGELKNAFMWTFKSCDPGLASCGPVMPKLGDPDYDNHMKKMTQVYGKLQGQTKIPLKSTGKARQVLTWLLQEYESPCCIPGWKAVSPSVALERLESTAQQLDDLLRELNYMEQRQTVEREIIGSNIVKAFLVPADGDFTQRWLVKRLSLAVPNHGQSRGFSVVAKPRWDRGLQPFWQSLSHYTDRAEAPEDIIQALCDRSQIQPLIMVIRGLEVITPHTLNTLLTEFWEPLIQKLDQQSRGRDREDCILFLTTNLKTACGTSHRLATDHGINLPPWDMVTVAHMQQWLKPQEVRHLLTSCRGEHTDLLPDLPSQKDLGPPHEILKQICQTFDLDGPADLESYWKIAS